MILTDNCEGYEDNYEKLLEDWKETKEETRHLHNSIMRLRLEGIPIGVGLQAVAFGLGGAIVPYLMLFGIKISVFSLIMFASISYLIPIFVLDLFHFYLLSKAVKHARCIENTNAFKNKILLTTKLTSKKYTMIHLIAGSAVFVVGISFGLSTGIYALDNPIVIPEHNT